MVPTPTHRLSCICNLFSLLRTTLPDRWSRRRGVFAPVQTFMGLLYVTVSRGTGYRNLCRRMYRDLGDLFGWDDFPRASSFCEAREKLSEEMLRSVFDGVYGQCETARAERTHVWEGMPIIAIDGTRITLQSTPALIAHFGQPRNQHGSAAAPQANLVVAWDVGAQQPVDFSLGRQDDSELTLAAACTERLPEGALVVADRGFISQRYIASLIQARRHVLVRCQTGPHALEAIRRFALSGRRDGSAELTASDGSPVPVRLIGNGTGDVFLTDLRDAERFPAAELLDVYAQRWRIETVFREMKVWHNLNEIRARKPKGVIQEVAAIMIFLLLVSELDAAAYAIFRDDIAAIEANRVPKPQRGRKPLPCRQPVVRFNRRYLTLCLQDLLTTLPVMTPAQIEREIQSILRDTWKERQLTKIGRSFPRKSTRPHSKWNRMRER